MKKKNSPFPRWTYSHEDDDAVAHGMQNVWTETKPYSFMGGRHHQKYKEVKWNRQDTNGLGVICETV